MNQTKTRALLIHYAFGALKLDKYFTKEELKDLGLSHWRKKYNSNVRRIVNGE